MGSSTQHLDLYKPDRTDYVSVITDLNNNLDKIDDFAGDVSEKFSGDALKVANGGTGATTAAGARNALGLGNTTGALPVANGGTGATTAAAARTNLGITPGNIGAVPAAGGTFTGTVVFSKSTDASGTQYNGPALVVGGNPTGAHIEIDNNEIIAKADETTGANLSLNFDGGGNVNIAAGSLIVHPTDGVTLKKALSIANGGTGATSAPAALTALGAAAKFVYKSGGINTNVTAMQTGVWFVFGTVDSPSGSFIGIMNCNTDTLRVMYKEGSQLTSVSAHVYEGVGTRFTVETGSSSSTQTVYGIRIY